jgi:hypothetical protein
MRSIKGEVVALYLEPLITKQMEPIGAPERRQCFTILGHFIPVNRYKFFIGNFLIAILIFAKILLYFLNFIRVDGLRTYRLFLVFEESIECPNAEIEAGAFFKIVPTHK